MSRVDLFAAGVLFGALMVGGPIGVFNYLTGSKPERMVDREAYGWKRYTEGATEGARIATLKCPYNYRMKP